jgi:hypothetical protein
VINARVLWAGGVATAIVAALVVLVGLLIVQELLDTSVVPGGDGLLGSQTLSLMFYAALAALAATALLHLLMLSTPRARTFFAWIMILLTIIVALLPLTVDDTWEVRIASSLIYLVTGIVITSLVTGVGFSALRRIDGTPGRA